MKPSSRSGSSFGAVLSIDASPGVVPSDAAAATKGFKGGVHHRLDLDQGRWTCQLFVSPKDDEPPRFVICVSDCSLGEGKVLNRYLTEELGGVNKRRIEKLKTAWESWVTRLSEVELDGLEKAIGDLQTMQKMRNWEEMVKHMGP